ncbi:hypothetical protein K7432_001194 [Basidiobolus ranarum]|uniref:Uncharacterized protein n=1 Tax=Basidiobolus ranarum TaxID=34480 RepID=A0ABR2X3D1_9FUNG
MVYTYTRTAGLPILRLRFGTAYTSRSFGSTAASFSATRKPLFDKILIANRGEIACRVVRTARKLGIKTVAVYSEADRHSAHVKMADEAYLIGPAASAESYLRMDKIVDVAKRSGSQAVHPGYGFLSENSSFADLLDKEKITFIGPPASAMISMGSKSESKEIMVAAKVPVVPGYHGPNQDVNFLKQEAEKIGYPILIKAILGGGGKGMRIVETPADFEEMLNSAKNEARKSFGDDQVLIEKYLVTPRHVEVQVFADKFGNAVHLFERDCSVQRRHQKILEEAPAPNLSAEIRALLGAKAVAAAKAVDYVGAGTVEFIMDNTDQKFYFMEMNTRLQVEHPVTEMVTGTDLVHWQLEVAAGNKLPKTQEELKLTGHAFEARIYAENPAKGFVPDTGKLLHVRIPEPSDSVRIETGVGQGDAVSVHYDPMIAKLVVRGDDRTDALRVLRKALGEYEIVGLNTNIDFLKDVVSHPAFIEGDVETGFIKKYESDLFKEAPAVSHDVLAQAALSLVLKDKQQTQSRTNGTNDPHSPWATLSGARLNNLGSRKISLLSGEKEVSVEIAYNPDGTYKLKVNNGETTKDFDQVDVATNADYENQLNTFIGDRKYCSNIVLKGEQLHVFGENGRSTFSLQVPAYLSAEKSDVAGSVKTPMPCKISQVLVQPGDSVKKGTPLIILEAMKMEHVIKAPFDGIISKVHFNAGDLAEENKSLVAFEQQEAKA